MTEREPSPANVFRGVVFALLFQGAFAIASGVVLWFFLNGWSL